MHLYCPVLAYVYLPTSNSAGENKSSKYELRPQHDLNTLLSLSDCLEHESLVIRKRASKVKRGLQLCKDAWPRIWTWDGREQIQQVARARPPDCVSEALIFRSRCLLEAIWNSPQCLFTLETRIWLAIIDIGFTLSTGETRNTITFVETRASWLVSMRSATSVLTLARNQVDSYI